MSLTEPTSALNWDAKQQSAFISYFSHLPEKPSSTVRFFNHSDYYTLHGDDAEMASEFSKTILKFMGSGEKLSYLVLKKVQFEQFVRELLLLRQYRVEVYVKSVQNKVNDWKLEYKGSPGNLAQFEEILFENNSTSITFSNYVMSVKIMRGNEIALACVNSTELKFQLCQVKDNECFTELEALIAQIGPKECLMPEGNSPDLISLRNVLERNGVLIARVKRSDFNVNDVLQDLDRLLYVAEGQTPNSAALPETNLTEALGCLNSAIKFLNLTGDEDNFNQFKLSTLDVHRFVRLDNAALYSLNILPKTASGSFNPQTKENFSLIGILDKCVTNQGKRLLEQWIKQPLKDFNLLNERLDIVERLSKDLETREVLQKDALARLPDLVILSKKLSSKRATLQDCYKVYQVVCSVPILIEILLKTGNACIKSTLVDPITEIKQDLEKYKDMIEEILDLDLVDRGEFFVKRSFDSELNEIYEKKEKIEEKMQALLRKTEGDLGYDDKTIRLECNDQHGYFFRVTLKEEHALRSNKKYRILDAIKGGVRFTNDKLQGLNEDYLEVKNAYEEQQKSVIQELFQVAAGYGDSLRSLNLYVATVDVLVSFANVTVNAKIPYTRPRLHKEGTGILKLTKARHPCIEQQDTVSFIPNDVDFSINETTFNIITGPNMCGKSTFIRSIGVCVLMAQIGCFVPCESADISLVDAILARVGAEDCQLKGLSTFMLEMIETSTIIKTATSNSLVIIDELGRGTSTYDGCGIAWAIAEYLATEVKCFSLFATHFHEITRMANMHPHVNNLHVTAVTTNNTITPLYQVKSGECDNSYGIHCAKMVDFPEDVIQWAKDHQKELEHSSGTQFIKDFEQSIKRKIIEDGDDIVKSTLRKLKEIQSRDGLSDEELMGEIGKIKSELENHDNLFIKGLLSQ